MKTTITYYLTRLALMVIVASGVGCSIDPTNTIEETSAKESTTEFIDGLLAAAQTQSGTAAFVLTLQALETMLEVGFIERAQLEAEQRNLSEDIPQIYVYATQWFERDWTYNPVIPIQRYAG
jgi:hypothetical protein